MNPSVEQAEDEPKLYTSDLHSGNEQLSWSKVSLRHESMLSSHLEMLHSARNAAHGDDNMVQTISSMLEKTNRLVSQFRVVKKQLKNGNKSRSESTTPGDANTAATAKSNFSTGNKRARAENEATNMTTDSAQENSSQKRKRLRSILSSNNEDMRGVTPVSIETEDISEEVQRRLEIKEEQRKKRGTSTSEKRKRNRDSLASNDSTSSSFGGASRPKKRRRDLGTAKTD